MYRNCFNWLRPGIGNGKDVDSLTRWQIFYPLAAKIYDDGIVVTFQVSILAQKVHYSFLTERVFESVFCPLQS